MHYRLIPFLHSPILTELVYDIYELKCDKENYTYTTAPNGILGLSIITDGNAFIKQNGIWNAIASESVYGLISKPDVIRMSAGFREFAIGFKPYFFHLLTAEKMCNIVNAPNLEAQDVFGKQEISRLSDLLKQSKTDESIVKALAEFVMLHFNPCRLNKRLLVAMNLIYHKEVYNVTALSNYLGVSTTGLRQLFQKGIGRSPKEVARIIRINKTLKSHRPQPGTLTELGLASGFFDQAHFIKEFKSTMGITPKAYFNNKALTFDFYNYGRWEGDIIVSSNET